MVAVDVTDFYIWMMWYYVSDEEEKRMGIVCVKKLQCEAFEYMMFML